jgi:hypothetical protein
MALMVTHSVTYKELNIATRRPLQRGWRGDFTVAIILSSRMGPRDLPAFGRLVATIFWIGVLSRAELTRRGGMLAEAIDGLDRFRLPSPDSIPTC